MQTRSNRVASWRRPPPRAVDLMPLFRCRSRLPGPVVCTWARPLALPSLYKQRPTLCWKIFEQPGSLETVCHFDVHNARLFKRLTPLHKTEPCIKAFGRALCVKKYLPVTSLARCLYQSLQDVTPQV